MKSLTELDVSRNRCSANSIPFPLSLVLSVPQTHLIPPRARIATISPCIRELTALTALNLDKNQLHELPPELCFCSRLTLLRVTNNPLTSPPPKIVNKGACAPCCAAGCLELVNCLLLLLF
eukprot:2665377-Rhodomonas_salina.2